MNEQNNNFIDKRKLKVLFSLMSILLLAPPMIRHEVSYYTTLFVFLAGRMVDLFAIADSDARVFFFTWQAVNRWGSIFACAVSFCFLHPSFADLFCNYVDWINALMFLFPLSCVLQELVALIREDIRVRTFKTVLKEESLSDKKERAL